MSQELKAEIYDLRQELTKAQNLVQVYSETLGGISQLLAVQPTEEGTVELQDIVKAVQKLVSSDAVV